MSIETSGYPDAYDKGTPIVRRIVKAFLGPTGLNSYIELDDGSRILVDGISVRASRDMMRSIDIDLPGGDVEIVGPRWNDQ